MNKWDAAFYKSDRVHQDTRKLKTGVASWKIVLADQVGVLNAAKEAGKSSKATQIEDGDEPSESEDSDEGLSALVPRLQPPPPSAPLLSGGEKQDDSVTLEEETSFPRFGSQYWTLYCVVGPYARNQFNVQVPATFLFDGAPVRGKNRAEFVFWLA